MFDSHQSQKLCWFASHQIKKSRQMFDSHHSQKVGICFILTWVKRYILGWFSPSSKKSTKVWFSSQKVDIDLFYTRVKQREIEIRYGYSKRICIEHRVDIQFPRCIIPSRHCNYGNSNLSFLKLLNYSLLWPLPRKLMVPLLLFLVVLNLDWIFPRLVAKQYYQCYAYFLLN